MRKFCLPVLRLDFKKLNTYKDETLQRIYNKANQIYTSSSDKESFLDDEEFDILEIYMTKHKIPFDKTETPIEISTTENLRRVKLPHSMPSLEYYKTNAEIIKWATKHNIKNFLVTPKLDGTSLQLIYKTGKLKFAYTKGHDGIFGNDVTRHVLEIPAIPKTLTKTIDISVRAEAYITNSVFADKYSNTFKTARNTVSGQLNRKEPDKDVLKDIKILVYHVYSCWLHYEKNERLFSKWLTYDNKYEELKCAGTYGLPIIPYVIFETNQNNLAKHLTLMRERNDVEMDGLVVEEMNNARRKIIGNETNSINPKFARAYKPNTGQIIQTTVKKVEWELSRTGVIQPTVNFDPVILQGVTVTNATAFNAAYIRDNKIGPGTIINVSRRGSVIPYIEKIIKPTKASMPPDMENYRWNSTNVSLFLKKDAQVDSVALDLKKITHFFKETGVEYFSDQLVERFYKAGYKTIDSILLVTDKEMLQKIPNFQTKMVRKVRNEFNKLKSPGVTMPQLMFSSSLFGRGLGKDKLEKIYNEFGEDCLKKWINLPLKIVKSKIDSIPGFSDKMAVQYYEGLEPFAEFSAMLLSFGLVSIKKITLKSRILKDQVIVPTEFRSDQLKILIQEHSGIYKDSLVKDATILLTEHEGINSKKVVEARNRGNIRIMTIDRFKEQYNL
jgi:DNA ligase (NAD+)